MTTSMFGALLEAVFDSLRAGSLGRPGESRHSYAALWMQLPQTLFLQQLL